MALTMTKEEREAFLADIHVAVMSVAEDGQRSQLDLIPHQAGIARVSKSERLHKKRKLSLDKIP